MILLPVWILDFSVGGERILMSRAVPRRRGTRGVSSTPIRGGLLTSKSEPSEEPSEASRESVGLPKDASISKASMSPGVMIILHSSG